MPRPPALAVFFAILFNDATGAGETMQRKIVLLIMSCVLVILLTVGIVSHLRVQESINHYMDSHLDLAQMISRNLDAVVEQNIARLQGIALSGDLSPGGPGLEAERSALREAYAYSLFDHGLFLMDLQGNVVLTYPPRDEEQRNLLAIPIVADAIAKNEVSVSGMYTEADTGQSLLYVLVPVKGADGEVGGFVGGEISPANGMLASFIRTVASDKYMSLDLVDSRGTVIASNRGDRVMQHLDYKNVITKMIHEGRNFVGICHNCHFSTTEGNSRLREEDVLVFVPLKSAPWGISIRHPSEIVFGPARSLRKSFLLIGALIIGVSVVLSVGLSRSIVRPLKELTAASERIAECNLDEPVTVRRSDEIGVLANSFELMRWRLNELLGRIQTHNQELEHRVAERTSELQRRKLQLSRLVREGMRAQEDERRRIARELHDETSQTLAAMGMSLEIATVALADEKLTPEMLAGLQGRVGVLVDGIHRIIQDLRPPVLDDLGLESAVRWLLRKNLDENGIEYTFSFSGIEDLEIEKKEEMRIFRIIQEALANIVRHSRASHVCFSMAADEFTLDIDIVDNGVGFDAEGAFGGSRADEGLKGYGLLGMHERVEQFSGAFSVTSFPLEETDIEISLPMELIVKKGSGTDIA